MSSSLSSSLIGLVRMLDVISHQMVVRSFRIKQTFAEGASGQSSFPKYDGASELIEVKLDRVN